MKTIVGLFDDWSNARQVVEELVRAGFHRDHISLVANDANKTFAQSLDTADDGMAAEGAATGAVAGGALGGLGGLLLGLGALAIPGVGPVIAAGPLAAALTGAAVGAATGGVIGALAGWGIPENEAGYYAEGVRRGGTLVGVQAEDHEVDRALNIMNRFGPVDIQRRSSEWRSSGWTGFDPDADVYTTGNGTSDWRSYDTGWRTHYNQYYGTTGHPYDYYQPGYRYGYDLANNPRYSGRDWNLIEADVRRDWEATGRGAWEDFKDAIRYGWNEVKQAVR